MVSWISFQRGEGKGERNVKHKFASIHKCFHKAPRCPLGAINGPGDSSTDSSNRNPTETHETETVTKPNRNTLKRHKLTSFQYTDVRRKNAFVLLRDYFHSALSLIMVLVCSSDFIHLFSVSLSQFQSFLVPYRISFHINQASMKRQKANSSSGH